MVGTSPIQLKNDHNTLGVIPCVMPATPPTTTTTGRKVEQWKKVQVHYTEGDDLGRVTKVTLSARRAQTVEEMVKKYIVPADQAELGFTATICGTEECRNLLVEHVDGVISVVWACD